MEDTIEYQTRYEKEYNNIRSQYKEYLKDMGYYGNLDEINDGRAEFLHDARKESR